MIFHDPFECMDPFSGFSIGSRPPMYGPLKGYHLSLLITVSLGGNLECPNPPQECSRCAEFNLTGERARLRRVGLELDLTLFYSNLWFSWLLGENSSTFLTAMRPCHGWDGRCGICLWLMPGGVHKSNEILVLFVLKTQYPSIQTVDVPKKNVIDI